MSDQIPAANTVTDAKRASVVALLLLLMGVTMLTVGVSLAFGVPAGLITLGGLLIAGGVLLGLT